MYSRTHSVLFAMAMALLMLVPMSSFADKYGLDEQHLEADAEKCRADPQCMAMFLRYEAQEAEQERQRELRDKALKESDPLAYYIAALGRILLAVLVVAGVIGAYTFLFSVGGKKK